VHGFGELTAVTPADALLDSVFCSATNALKIAEMPVVPLPEELREKLPVNVQACTGAPTGPNRRLYFDGDLTARYELDFVSPNFASRGQRLKYGTLVDAILANHNLVEPILNALSGIRARVARNRDLVAWEGSLLEAGAALAKSYAAATTEPKVRPSFTDCQSGIPIIIATLLEKSISPPAEHCEVICDWRSGRIERIDASEAILLVVRQSCDSQDTVVHANRLSRGLARFHVYAETAKYVSRYCTDRTVSRHEPHALNTLVKFYDLEEQIARRIDLLAKRAPQTSSLSFMNTAIPTTPLNMNGVWQPPADNRLVPLLRPRDPSLHENILRYMGLRSRYKVFISYRRQDAANVQSVRLVLERHLGARAVFFDLKALKPGLEFPQQILEALLEARFVVAVIGKNWLGQSEESNHEFRINLPTDWVRRELEIAFNQNKVIVPVLIDREKYPAKLPPSLAALLPKQFLRVSTASPDFDHQLNRLIEVVTRRAVFK
jgi:hypothetical protein